MLQVSRIALWALVLGLGNLLFGQPFETLLPLEGGITNEADIQVFSDESDGMMFIREGNVGRVLVLDRDLQVTQQFRVDELPDLDSYTHMGYTYRDGNLHMYFLNRETGYYSAMGIYPESQSTESFSLGIQDLRKDNAYWGTFTYQGTLHTIRLPRGSKQIRLCRFEGGESFSVQKYDVTNEAFLQVLESEMVRIDQGQPADLAHAFSAGKLFLDGHELYLTLDQAGQSLVIHIDLLTQTKKELAYPVDLRNGRHNAVIQQHTLYQWAYTTDSLQLTITDLRTGTRLQQLTYSTLTADDMWLSPAEKYIDDQRVGSFPQTASFLTEISQLPFPAIGFESVDEFHISLQLGAVGLEQERGIGGVLLEEHLTKVYGTITLDRANGLLPLSEFPPALANRRFPPLMAERLPHFKLFTIQGVRYFGYYDLAKGGYVLSR